MSNEPQKIELTAHIVEPDKSKGKNPLLSFLTSPVILAIITALLTSLVAPYIIERTRQSASLIQQERDKQEQIRKTQFEIVENLNRILWTYRTSADFLVYDFRNGQPDENLLKKHIDTYMDVAERTNRELAIEAFRARMYFQNKDVYERLIKGFYSIFKTDAQISKQLIDQRYKYVGNNPLIDERWDEIKEQVNGEFESFKILLDELFREIGRSK
jgi:hypothetical protein